MILTMLSMLHGRSALTDQEIIDAVRRGELDGFAELYRRHADRIYGLFTRLVGPVGEREDLVQEAFIEAYRALPQFRGEAAFATFLYRIAVRVGCDFLRRRGGRPTIAEDALGDLVSPEASPLEQTEQRRELDRAFRVLGTLSPKRRAAFALVAVEGLSLREAGELLGVDEQAVKQRVLAARKEILSTLAKEQKRGRHV